MDLAVGSECSIVGHWSYLRLVRLESEELEDHLTSVDRPFNSGATGLLRFEFPCLCVVLEPIEL